MNRKNPNTALSSVYSQDSNDITQDFPLIITKLNPPRSTGGLLERPRLQSKLAETKSWTLAVVCAGAGFGKTTLLTQWYNLLKQKEYCAAWLSLDTEDNQINTFYRYLIGSLSQAFPPDYINTLRDIVASSKSVEQLTASLINVLYQYSKPADRKSVV